MKDPRAVFLDHDDPVSAKMAADLCDALGIKGFPEAFGLFVDADGFLRKTPQRMAVEGAGGVWIPEIADECRADIPDVPPDIGPAPTVDFDP